MTDESGVSEVSNDAVESDVLQPSQSSDKMARPRRSGDFSQVGFINRPQLLREILVKVLCFHREDLSIQG